MANEDIVQIKIGTFLVGIIGLQEVMAELAAAMSGASDEAVAGELIQRLSRKKKYP